MPHPRELAVPGQTFSLGGVGTLQLGFLVLSFCHLHSDSPANGPELPIQRADARLSGVPVVKEKHFSFG